MIEGKFKAGTDDLSDAFEIRKQVFHIEQGVDPALEFDQWDKKAVHVVVYNGSKAVATGRVLKMEETYKIGRIAVLKEERGKQYGDFLVRMLIDRAFQAGAAEVTVGAQLHAVGFYEKIGFHSYGNEYEEAGIRHIPMKIGKQDLCKKCKGH